jgi:hypothetical protein
MRRIGRRNSWRNEIMCDETSNDQGRWSSSCFPGCDVLSYSIPSSRVIHSVLMYKCKRKCFQNQEEIESHDTLLKPSPLGLLYLAT